MAASGGPTAPANTSRTQALCLRSSRPIPSLSGLWRSFPTLVFGGSVQPGQQPAHQLPHRPGLKRRVVALVVVARWLRAEAQASTFIPAEDIQPGSA